MAASAPSLAASDMGEGTITCMPHKKYPLAHDADNYGWMQMALYQVVTHHGMHVIIL